MIAPLILGGPISRPCLFCKAPVGVWCDAGGHRARALHAARTEDAPPIVEAHVGDLVLVRHRGEHVAQLVDIGDPGRAALTVRFWRPSAQVFGSPRLLEREAVIGLAPDDARTALAREELRGEAARLATIATGGDGAAAVHAVESALAPRFVLPADIAEGRGPFDPGRTWADDLRNCRVCGNPANCHAESDGFEIYEDGVQICDGFEPMDPKRPPRPEAEERIEARRLGQDTSDPLPAAADKPRDPWFTADSAPTKALPKGW